MNSSDSGSESSPIPVRVTDSPWFWLPLFLVGALVALTLTAPKFRWRQPQIERQFQARERAGQAVSAKGGYSRLSTTGDPMLTLKPLLVFFTVALFIMTVGFWWRRFTRLQRATVVGEVIGDDGEENHRGEP